MESVGGGSSPPYLVEAFVVPVGLDALDVPLILDLSAEIASGSVCKISF